MGSGGAERVISTLSNEFVKKGHSVGILMMSIEATQSYYDLDDSVALLKLLNGKDFGFFKKSKILRKKIEEYKPDIVISFLSYICIYTWWALRRTNIPYIVSERSDPTQRKFLKQFLMNQSFKKASGCVLQTKDALNFYQKVGKGKSIVIHNPVHLSSNRSSKDTVNKIVAVGSLVGAKNYPLLINAFKIFKSKHKEFVLKIYGDGPLRDSLEGYLKENNISDVTLCHKSKNWHSEECDARIFALSSYTEGMPNVLEEALCLGIPSVSTDCSIGGPKELKSIFKEQLVLSKNNNVDDFANALELALTIEQKKTNIPDCLSSNFIVDVWLEFIRKRIGHI